MTYIIILLILIELNLFKGWFLALWIIGVTLRIIDFIVSVIIKLYEME